MNGFFLLDKPVGISSASLLNKLKHKLSISKLGHTGTLDPFASGLLVIMVNRATKLFDFFLKEDKVYEVVMQLGIATDTYDIEGNILDRTSKIPSEAELIDATKIFTGSYRQEVPPFSAVKRKGKPLYVYARRGLPLPELPKKLVSIYGIDIKYFNNKTNEVSMEVSCSGGTYIRSLVNDMGKFLKTYAHVKSLRRLKAGFFDLNNAKKLEDITKEDLLSISDFLYSKYQDNIERVSSSQFRNILEKVRSQDTFKIYEDINKRNFIIFKGGRRIYL